MLKLFLEKSSESYQVISPKSIEIFFSQSDKIIESHFSTTTTS